MSKQPYDGYMAAVRSEPKECAPIGTLNYGDRIAITGEKNGFYQMENGLWIRTYAIRKAPK